MFYRKVKTENWSTLQCYTYQIQKQRQQWMHLHHVNGEMLLHHSATKQQRNKIHTQILRAKPPYKTDSKHAMLSIVLPSEISSIKHLVRVDSFQATLQRCFHTHTHRRTHPPTHTSWPSNTTRTCQADMTNTHIQVTDYWQFTYSCSVWPRC